MLGRGIDQILPYPSDPALHEPYVRDARDYVRLAVRRNGELDYPVSWRYVWGDALSKLAAVDPVARVVNLETSITSSASYDSNKSIHYRMHPQNIACLTAAGIDCCVLANNHVLDWGRPGLVETFASLEAVGIVCAGAGRSAEDAWAPAQLALPTGGRLLVFGLGFGSSGIPHLPQYLPARPGTPFRRSHTRSLAGSAQAISCWHRFTGVGTGAMALPRRRSSLPTAWWMRPEWTSCTGTPRIM